jgi:hypothetical protein
MRSKAGRDAGSAASDGCAAAFAGAARMVRTKFPGCDGRNKILTI